MGDLRGSNPTPATAIHTERGRLLESPVTPRAEIRGKAGLALGLVMKELLTLRVKGEEVNVKDRENQQREALIRLHRGIF